MKYCGIPLGDQCPEPLQEVVPRRQSGILLENLLEREGLLSHLPPL